MGLEVHVDAPLKLKRFFLRTDKYAAQVRNDFEDELDRAANDWLQQVESALSVPFSNYKAHGIRPDADFPHENTGRLKDSAFAEVQSHITASGKNISFTTIVGIAEGYGAALNKGYKKRKDGVVPSWVGWQDRIFEQSRGDIETTSELFDWLSSLRTQL